MPEAQQQSEVLAPSGAINQMNTQNLDQLDNVDLQIFSMKMDSMQKQIKELESKFELANGRVEEVTKASKLKFDSVQKAYKKMELYVTSRFQTHQSQFAEMSGKITSQKLRDIKIEELINRQNQMVQSFEARMGDMKKVISEQQYQILNLKGALKEAIRRLHK